MKESSMDDPFIEKSMGYSGLFHPYFKGFEFKYPAVICLII